MAGYANRVTKIEFPDLTEEGQPTLFITIKNPKVIPPDELMSEDVEVGPDGRPLDPKLAAQRSAEVIASLVVAWRMYDASDFAVDKETGEPLDQRPLPLPATPELVQKLPTKAILELNKVLTEAVDPQ
jgi:hypothetical protein